MPMLIGGFVIVLVFISGFMTPLQNIIAGITGMDDMQSFMFSLLIPSILIMICVYLLFGGLGKKAEGAWGEGDV